MSARQWWGIWHSEDEAWVEFHTQRKYALRAAREYGDHLIVRSVLLTIGEDVERSPWNDRGFLAYGAEPITCTYGSVVSVSESSAADDDFCWLRIDGFDAPKNGTESFDGRKRSPLADPLDQYQAAAHLTRDDVRMLVGRLSAWLEDNPADLPAPALPEETPQ